VSLTSCIERDQAWLEGGLTSETRILNIRYMDYWKANEQHTMASPSLLISAPFSNEVIKSKVYRYFPGVLPPIQRVRQVPVKDLSLDAGHWPQPLTNPRLNEPALSRKPWLKNSGQSASLSIRDSPKPSRLSNWEAKSSKPNSISA
jgi:hypothetical protein